MFNYLKSLAQVNSGNSSKSFSLLISAITGGILALCMAFCMVWDVVKNDHIVTDLTEMGVFILCVGGFIAGSGLTKMVSNTNKASFDATMPEKQDTEEK